MTNFSSLAAGTAAVLAVTFVDSPQVLETTDGLVKFVSVSHPDSDRHPGMIQYLSKHNAIVGKISNISDDFRSKIRGINAVSVSPPRVWPPFRTPSPSSSLSRRNSSATSFLSLPWSSIAVDRHRTTTMMAASCHDCDDDKDASDNEEGSKGKEALALL